MRKPGGAHLRDRQPAAGKNHRGRSEIAMIGTDPIPVAPGDAGDPVRQTQIDPYGIALRQQHRHHRPRRPIAEQLTKGFFVPGNPVLADQIDKIMLGVAGQR